MLSDNYRHEVAELNKAGKVIKFFRVLEPKEIIAIHAELSKMDGSYAPQRQEFMISKGLDIDQYLKTKDKRKQ